ncbi:hypothetical protein KHQ81_06040 [Mycoplasmatota bacterium]|nr:hypothetical protein KHQ81_06040 [Mycoplasmatota bacterium]
MLKFIAVEILMFFFWYLSYLHFESDDVKYINEIDYIAAEYIYIILFIINIVLFFVAIFKLIKYKISNKTNIYWQFLLFVFNFGIQLLQLRFYLIYILSSVIYYFLIKKILNSNNKAFDTYKSSLRLSDYNKIQKILFWLSTLIYIVIYYLFYIFSYKFIEIDVSGSGSLAKYIGGILFTLFLLVSFVQEDYRLNDSN